MKPRVFIGSSLEGKDLCGALRTALLHEAHVSVWHEIFGISGTTIESLLEKFGEHDFGIFVFSPDDFASMRSTDYLVTRDNVLFEAGLFMGMHGRHRTFIVTPLSTPSFHIPSDLLGFTTAKYDPEQAHADPVSGMGAAAFAVSLAIKEAYGKQPDIDVHAFVSSLGTATWPLKLNIEVKNKSSVAVSVESLNFVFGQKAPKAPNEPVLRRAAHKPAFKVGLSKDGKDVYSDKCLLEPGQTVMAWVPFDPSIAEADLKALHTHQQCGVWKYRCVWHDQVPTARLYERAF